jgi:CheY-like chemotaxis protein
MKHCLIVDDSRVIRKVSSHIVEGFGFEVSEAENGLVALERCREKMPDLVLLDWNMPVMSGIEFIVALREMEGGRGPKGQSCSRGDRRGCGRIRDEAVRSRHAASQIGADRTCLTLSEG